MGAWTAQFQENEYSTPAQMGMEIVPGDNARWSQIIRANYAAATDIFTGSGVGGSPLWKSLHKIKHFFKLGAKHMVGDGKRTMFWLDLWVGR
jgi:hypothetical protein